MHADIIVVGNGWQAFLSAYMFANRGLRTLVFPASNELEPPRHLLLQNEVANQMRSVMPPERALLNHNLNFEFWSSTERQTVALKQIPFLVVDSKKYEKQLVRLAMKTRNVRVITERKVGRPMVADGQVRGVQLTSGEEVEARLVVDCGAGQTVLNRMLEPLWDFPSVKQYQGTIGAERREVGEAASAWQLGTFSYHWVPGRHMTWRYRYDGDHLEVGTVAPAGVSTRVERRNRAMFLESGLANAPEVGTFQRHAHLGPPLPVSCCPGYVAVGAAGGYGNPFLPLDISGAFTGIYLAYTACMHAFEEGDLGADMLWVYPRSMARRWASAQAYTYMLGRYLFSMDDKKMDGVLATGLLDAYALSCLLRSQVNEEGSLDRLARLGRGLKSPGAALYWGRAVRKANAAAEAFRSAPYEWNESAVAKWQKKVVAALS